MLTIYQPFLTKNFKIVKIFQSSIDLLFEMCYNTAYNVDLFTFFIMSLVDRVKRKGVKK